MSEPTLEELQQQNKELAEKLEAAQAGSGDDESRKRLEFLETEHKKLIKDRDAAKEAKRIEEEKRLAEQGEFKTLAEQRASELEKLTGDLDGHKAKLAEYQERDKKELESILVNVPENLRDMVSDEALPLEKRLSLARELSTTKQKTPDYRGPGEQGNNSITRQAFDAMPAGDRSAFVLGGGTVHD